MNRLSGKVAVITGGTRGLGLAIALAYAAQGATVVVASRSQESVDKAVSTLTATGAQASGHSCDVGNGSQVRALRQETLARYGQLDIWVNNAGLSAPYGPTLDIPPQRFLDVLQTNILGTYYGSWVAMQHFISQDRGKLINLLGRGDDKPVPLQNAYASSKAWIRSFTLALAQEYEETSVGVFAFNPGLVKTDLITNVDVIAGYEERVKPLETVTRMWANPPEVPAQKAVWLASSATDGRTGLEVNVLTPARIVVGLLQEGWRRFTNQPAEEAPLTVHTVAPHPS